MSEVAEIPVEAGATKSNKELNKERLAKLKEAKAKKDAKDASGVADVPGGEGSTKKVREPKAPKEKTVRSCRCGCGGQTTAFFVPGHDARFKGWLKKIEKGLMEPKQLPEAAFKEYTWSARGVGFVPDKNYKGEAYVPQCSLEEVTEKPAKSAKDAE